MEDRKYYRRGLQHLGFKTNRNYSLIKDRFPNWPATGTIGMCPLDLQIKYRLCESRIYAIIRLMKRVEFEDEQ